MVFIDVLMYFYRCTSIDMYKSLLCLGRIGNVPGMPCLSESWSVFPILCERYVLGQGIYYRSKPYTLSDGTRNCHNNDCSICTLESNHFKVTKYVTLLYSAYAVLCPLASTARATHTKLPPPTWPRHNTVPYNNAAYQVERKGFRARSLWHIAYCM